MNKLKQKLTSRSSSSRPKALNIAQKHSTGGSLAHVSTTDRVVSGVGGSESQPEDPFKQFEVNSGHCLNTSPNPDSTNVAGKPPDQAISVPVDGDLQSSRIPTSLPSPAKGDKTGPGHNDALPALKCSSLWQKAMEIVKTDEDWERYVAIIDKNAELHGSDVDSPEGVVQIAKKLSDQLETSKTTLRLAGRTIVVRDVLNKVLDVLALSKDLGTALTSLNPYASTGWKGLQFFIQAAVANKEVAALCWDELPQMVRLMSQYQTFETIYDTSKLKNTGNQLEAALVRLFCAILRYQVVIVNYASSWTDRFKAAFQGKVASMPQRVLDDIKQHEAEVDRLQTLADRETIDIQFQALVDLYKANSQELQKALVELQEANLKAQDLGNITTTQLESISEWTEVTRRDAILSWISTIKYRDAHNNRDKKAMEGTGEWLVLHPKYLHWRSSKQATVLWLHGLMGSGKSCLTHKVIEDLERLTSASAAMRLAYFYCNGSSEQGRKDIESADKILRCLLQQLSRVGIDGKLMNSILKVYTDTHLEGHLSENQCADLLSDLINQSETTAIVIDGLDECSLEVQDGLMTTIAGLLEGCIGSLRIFVSSRCTENIVDLLQDLPVTEINMTHNNSEDIEKFVRRTAHEAASRAGNRRKYVSGDRNQEVAVVKRLLRKSGGMFRWVDLAFKFLHASVDYDAMSNRLNQLSQLGQLFDLYDKIYDDIMRQVDAADQARIRTLLTFMLHGRRDMDWLDLDVRSEDYPSNIARIAETLEACEFSATASPDNMPMSVERVRTLCPDLVVITSKRHYELAFPHVSVREWLLASCKYSNIFARHPGNVYISQLCMKVICTSAKKPEAFIGRNQNGESGQLGSSAALLQYSAHGWLDHLFVLVYEQQLPHRIGRIWSEDNLLRTTLEEFLFNLDQSSLATGFQLWHKLLRRQTSFYWLPSGFTPRNKLIYEPIQLESLVPAVICGHLKYYCDLSRFPEAAMKVTAARTLATVVSLCDSEAFKWLTEQLHPSPEVLTQALLHYVSFCIQCRYNGAFGINTRQSRAEIFRVIRLLVASGIDVNGRCGRSDTLLIELLFAAWLDSGCGRACGKNRMAIVIACVCELELDILVPIHISNEVLHHKLEPMSLSFFADLQTVFDWLLYWSAVSDAPGIEALFLAQPWSKSVWTRWLTLAVHYTDCSAHHVQSCLEHGADPVITDEAGYILLQVAIHRQCNGPVLDLLSAASYAADSELNAEVVDPQGDLLLGIISKCSKNTIELWQDRGANLAGYTISDRNGCIPLVLGIAKRRTNSTGDPSVENYIRSLGIATPPGSPTMNHKIGPVQSSGKW